MPSNPVTAFAEGNILQIIVFAIALGVSINLIGERGAPAVRLFDALAETFYKLTDLGDARRADRRLRPDRRRGRQPWRRSTAAAGGRDRRDLPASIAHVLLVYGGLLGLLGRLNPLRFFRGIAPALAVAFSTSSSSGTLPVSIECARKNLGVSEGVAGFVLPAFPAPG